MAVRHGEFWGDVNPTEKLGNKIGCQAKLNMTTACLTEKAMLWLEDARRSVDWKGMVRRMRSNQARKADTLHHREP